MLYYLHLFIVYSESIILFLVFLYRFTNLSENMIYLISILRFFPSLYIIRRFMTIFHLFRYD